MIGAIQAGMSGDAARVRIATHVGAAHAVEPAQKIRVTHPAGLGLPGRGWDRRLARVDGLEVMPSEDAVRLLLTDLGLSERMRLGILDTVQQWILYLAGTGEAVDIDDLGGGLHLIGKIAGYYPDAPWDDSTVTIWTPGAEEPGYRRSWRAMWAEGDDLVVQGQGAPAGISSTVDPLFADPVLGAGWAVMQTDLLDPFYRQDFIRASDKTTGELESGRQGFQYSAY